MTPVFFITRQCLHKSEFDIYEVLVDAPKQRSLKFNYFATEKDPHNSKAPGSIISLLFSVIKEIFPSSVLSCLGYVCYLFHLLKTKNSQSKFTVKIFVCST